MYRSRRERDPLPAEPMDTKSDTRKTPGVVSCEDAYRDQVLEPPGHILVTNSVGDVHHEIPDGYADQQQHKMWKHV